MTIININLDNVDLTKFGKCRAEILILKDSATVTVPKDEQWIILTGMIHHITLTQTYFLVFGNIDHYNAGYGAVFNANVAAATASEDIDLFCAADTMSKVGGWRPLILSPNAVIVMSGGADATVQLQVLKATVK